MGQFSETTSVDASIGDTFALITDQDRVADWNEHVQYVEVVGGDPVGVGTRLRQHRRRKNREFDLEFVVTDHEPPNRHVVEGKVFGVNTTMAFLLQADLSGGTTVTMQANTNGRSLARILAPIVTKEMRKSTVAALAALKQHLSE